MILLVGVKNQMNYELPEELQLLGTNIVDEPGKSLYAGDLENSS
jgi:hypothetical protein